MTKLLELLIKFCMVKVFSKLLEFFLEYSMHELWRKFFKLPPSKNPKKNGWKNVVAWSLFSGAWGSFFNLFIVRGRRWALQKIS